MVDNLPLIPDKGATVCTDVRPVLREVFKELNVLPPLGTEQREANKTEQLFQDKWITRYETESKEIWEKEGEIKQKYAQRIARDPLPNIYKLHEPKKLCSLHDQDTTPNSQKDLDMLDRGDLMPSIAQASGKNGSLWIKNILTTSSGGLTSMEVRGSRMRLPVKLTQDQYTVQSMSIGEVFYPPPPPLPPVSPIKVPPKHIVCVPPELKFINFTVGQSYTQLVRLVNVSAFEVRLSVRPPERVELDLQLAGPRGLTIYAGSAAKILVHFRPRDIRRIIDSFLVRVSTGATFMVPITCYLQPPLLNIMVPSATSAVFSCPTGEDAVVNRWPDVLELGAKLLGDVHTTRIIFDCDSDNAEFFMLTEEAWLNFSLNELTNCGSIVSGPFAFWPAWWSGGGKVRGRAWCRADSPGLHAASIRILSSTAVVRSLHVLADSLCYKANHISIKAHEKDYDICSDDDPACEYYVNLGTAFPKRSLTATVQLINHSPVPYSFYWSVRPWGVCTCNEDFSGMEEETSELCLGALEARERARTGAPELHEFVSARLVRVDPARGVIAPQSSCALQVRAPNVGDGLGTQRAVLMLILKDIPRESIPEDCDPIIVKTEVLESEPIPGVKCWTREVCDVINAQMEVWWHVAPVRFVVDPPFVPIIHSRRIKSVKIPLRATQMYGVDSIQASWQLTPHAPQPTTVIMTPHTSCTTDIDFPLPALPYTYPENDIITLEATSGEWQSKCNITRQCATRHPGLQPARVHLGLVPPGTLMKTSLQIVNDTHEQIYWWCTPTRWLRERDPGPVCEDQIPCGKCHDRKCACDLLKPTRGCLNHSEFADINYNVHAPDSDGCVMTLVQLRRTNADVSHVCDGAGTQARASLISYRVLAPRLILRVLPCYGDKTSYCSGCTLDSGAMESEQGTSILRPLRPLTVGLRSCYRLCISNITPIRTVVRWDPPLENDVLNVLFIPNEFNIRSYEKVQIQVVLVALKVTNRRLFVFRGQVEHAYKPIYLVVDTAIAGVELEFEVPIGEKENTDSKLIFKKTQREVFPRDAAKVIPKTPEDIFLEDDKKRQVVARNICQCPFEMVYIPPEKRPMPPPNNSKEFPPIEIVCEPPPLSRVCSCFNCTKPIMPEHTEPLCLQFTNVPLKTVRSRTITLRNLSVLTAKFTTALRRWTRKHTRSLHKDSWAGDVTAPGIVVQCTPSTGLVAPRGAVDVHVQVYADCWGLYRNQLLFMVENLEPTIIDMWIEAVGVPLQFALTIPDPDAIPFIWFSECDPQRTVRVKNRSRTELIVHAYITKEHDLLGESSELESTSTCEEEMETGIELFLTEDHGVQCSDYYEITPVTTTILPGAWHEWQIALNVPLHEEHASDSTVLLRAIPVDRFGEDWYRPNSPPQLARLRHSPRGGCVRLSCSEIVVKLCALDLPENDVLRVRKTFHLLNVGAGSIVVGCRSAVPWALILDNPGEEKSGAECRCAGEGPTPSKYHGSLSLLPRCSKQIFVEARVSTQLVWPESGCSPCQPPIYSPTTRSITTLQFYDDDNVLLTLPLILELEYPIIDIVPSLIDFDFVTDGDTRKSYFTVSQSSRTTTLEVVIEWAGSSDFKLWPHSMKLNPGRSERIYIQYLAKYCRAPVEGCVRVKASCPAGAWCRAVARARAAPARDLAYHKHVHDYTDDTHLKPMGFN